MDHRRPLDAIESLGTAILQTTDYTDDNFGTMAPINVHSNFNGIVLDLVYGRQMIFGNFITLDWFGGIGYGLESKTVSFLPSGYSDQDSHDRYSHEIGSSTFPIAFTAGLKVGYIFKTPYWISHIGQSNSRNSKPPSRHSMGGNE